MGLKINFELLAEYNQWINMQFYQAAAQLTQPQLDKEQGAYFGSINGTLNHILVGDIIWLKRFAVHPTNFVALHGLKDFETPSALDQPLYDNFVDMREARRCIDEMIFSFCLELNETDLEHRLSYTNSKGLLFHKNFGSLLQHFFNHQTHHRGQVSTLLYQQGVDVGVTDLLMKIPD